MKLVLLLAILGLTNAACPNKTVVDANGYLSVKLFGAIGDAVHDDAPAVHAAIRCYYTIGGIIFFPPGYYLINSTIVIADEADGVAQLMSIKGGGGVPARPAAAARHKWVGRPPSTVLFSNAPGPIFQIGDFDGRVADGVEVSFEDLSIQGTTMGVYIQGAAGITFRNCGVSASVWWPDDGSETRENNAAIVISDVFWVWFDSCTFENPDPPPPTPPTKIVKSDRPSVILRGTTPTNTSLAEIDQTYLIRFNSVNFLKGGVQYQQLVAKTVPPVGYIEMYNTVQEDSWTPLLDFVSDPAVATVGIFEQITIVGYMDADTKGGSKPVVRFNMTQPDARLDGLLIAGAGDTYAAIQVLAGTLTSAVVLDGHGSGAQQCIDGNGMTIGSSLLKTPGGIALIGLPESARTRAKNSSTLHDAGAAQHALLLGESSAPNARLAIDADGSILFGNGTTSEFDTILERFISVKGPWGPLHLAANTETSINVTVPGAAPGDVAQAALSSVGDSPVTLTAAVAAVGRVVVVCAVRPTASLAAGSNVSIKAGQLRVVVSKFA